jgi:hypothetical protein
MTSTRASKPDHTRLRQFAATHHLKIRLQDTPDENDYWIKERLIVFGPPTWPIVPLWAVITDLPNDVELRMLVSYRADGRRLLRQYDAEKRLCLGISPDHLQYLEDAIGFQLSFPTRHSKAPRVNPKSTPWDKLLRALEIRQLEGDREDGVTLTFPVDDEAAVKLVLALAQPKVFPKGLPVKK